MLRRLSVLFAAGCVLVAPVVASSSAGAVGYAQPRVVSADPVNHTPHVLNGTVLAVATVGDRVYVGGTFTSVTNAGSSTALTRRYLFAFDRSTGRVADFAPSVDGTVETIAAAPDGVSIIIGGRFRTVQGTAQRSLAMVTSTGARVSSFTATTNGYVNKALVRGSRLIVGGTFSTANGVSRSNLAAFTASSGRLDTGFAVGVTQGRTLTDGTTTAAGIVEMDADAAGSKLVIVGNFRQVGGQRRTQVAMINLAENSVSSWYTNR